MARTARAEIQAGVYHVYARGNRKQDIFLDDRDRRHYLRLLERTIRSTGWWCLSYCLMRNHMHLLIETREPNLGVGMHRLHGGYARDFNRRHALTGRMFQSRYDAQPVKSDEQLWTTAAYIARNPVAAGLCESAADWLWSSHADVILDCPPQWLAAARLLDYFSTDGGDGRERYATLVALPPSPRAS